MLKINLFIEGKMQRNITEKLKISKSQKNNSIKLLAATIALSAGLTAMDEAAAILDDELGAKKASSKKSDVGAVKDSAHDKEDHDKKSVKYLKDEENLDEQSKKKDNVTDEETVKSVKQTQLAKLKEIKEDENEVEEGFTVQNEKDVKIGDNASALPPKDVAPVAEELKLESKDLRIGEEKKKEENGENDAVKVDDLVRTLTGEEVEDEQVGPVRGNKPNERVVDEILEKDEDRVAANACPSAPIKEEQKQLVKAPTVANVVVGMVVFLGQSAGSAISYLTPDFVKSFYGNVTAFFTSLGEIRRFFRTKK